MAVLHTGFMRRFDVILFVILIGYLISGWSGFWSVEKSGHKDDQLLQLTFEPGFFEILKTENIFLEKLQDQLIEKDSKPNRLFEQVHRDYTQNLVLAVSSAFLLLFSFFTIAVGISKRWFYNQMKIMVFFPVSLFLLVGLLSSPVQIPYGLSGFSNQVLFFGPLLIKSSILFLCTTGWIIKPKQIAENNFLNYLRSDPLNLRSVLRDQVRPTVVDLLIIAVIGTLLTNFVLLPLFQLQIHFAEYFGFILVPGLLLLAFYYIRSYHKVALLRNEQSSWLTSVAFLSFRFMRNVLFLSVLIFAIVFVLGAILTFSYSNLNLLIRAGILTELPGI